MNKIARLLRESFNLQIDIDFLTTKIYNNMMGRDMPRIFKPFVRYGVRYDKKPS